MTRLRINRLFRFGLRSLFVGVAILCVVLGMKVHRVKQQREAIAWVHDMEGTVEYEYQVTGNLAPVFTGNPKGPQWWQELIGVDCVPTPHFVTLRRVTDLRPLTELTELVGLSVDSESNGLRDLSPLANLTHLQFLSVVSDELSDVSPLAMLTDLQVLGLLSRQKLDLSPLAKLTSLQRLLLRADEDTDLSPLMTLTNLKEAYFDSPLGNDEELARLRQALPNCRIDGAPTPIKIR